MGPLSLADPTNESLIRLWEDHVLRHTEVEALKVLDAYMRSKPIVSGVTVLTDVPNTLRGGERPLTFGMTIRMIRAEVKAPASQYAYLNRVRADHSPHFWSGYHAVGDDLQLMAGDIIFFHEPHSGEDDELLTELLAMKEHLKALESKPPADQYLP